LSRPDREEAAAAISASKSSNDWRFRRYALEIDGKSRRNNTPNRASPAGQNYPQLCFTRLRENKKQLIITLEVGE
jgi:hypothetical protein